MATKTAAKPQPEDAVASTAEAGASVAEDTAGAAEEVVSSAADDAIDALTLNQQAALETAESAGAAMIDGVTRFHREVVDFVSERIRHDMETQQELLRCRSLDEVRDVQTRFFRTAMNQYSGEAERLVKLGTEVLHRSMERRPG